MKNIEDISCWIVFIKPFKASDRCNRKIVLPYQKLCISNSIFGMGWPLDTDSISFEQKYCEKLGEKYIDEYIEKESCSPSKKALKSFGRMKPNDIVITRLMNGHYQIGTLTTDALFLHKKDSPYEELSWGCRVEKWYEVLEQDLPARIRGRFSQSNLGTVQSVSDQETKKLIYSVYLLQKYGRNLVPPIILNNENFVQNLDYKELEDLVFLYMWDIHKTEGYVLLPSSCKSNQPIYEFFIAKGTKDIITCQVKSQRDAPEPDEYLEDKHIRIIYIFSGKWKEDHDALEYQNRALSIGARNIRAIYPSDLFLTLQKHKDMFVNEYRIVM